MVYQGAVGDPHVAYRFKGSKTEIRSGILILRLLTYDLSYVHSFIRSLMGKSLDWERLGACELGCMVLMAEPQNPLSFPSQQQLLLLPV